MIELYCTKPLPLHVRRELTKGNKIRLVVLPFENDVHATTRHVTFSDNTLTAYIGRTVIGNFTIYPPLYYWMCLCSGEPPSLNVDDIVSLYEPA
jgi:hypothetical protein